MKMKRMWMLTLFMICLVAIGILSFSQKTYAKAITSLQQAEELALRSVKNARVTDAEQEYKNGILIYEIQLRKGTKEYEIVYRASDGKMLSYEWEEQRVQRYSKKKIMDQATCGKLAAKKVKDGKIISVTGKYDDGIYIYKVTVVKADKKYTLKFHARTGRLLEYKWKLATQRPQNQNTYIGKEKAIKIAFAKVPGADLIKVELDKDDGMYVYEIELVKDRIAYEIKIHAKTGKVLEIDKEYIDDIYDYA